MSAAIIVSGLKKSYGDREILKGVSFQVEKGEIFSLLGVNGAGKTTTLECIEGLLQYDSGSININGKAGIQLQSSSLPEHMRPMEAVELFARWNRTTPDASLLKRLGIPELGRRQYRQLSTGQKRRLHLALAMSGEPDILFLDEPTAGLDVEGRLALHGLLRELNGRGVTIIVASHDMAEVESLAHRIAILREGVIAFSGTIPELNCTLGTQYEITITTDLGVESLETQDVTGAMIKLLTEYRASGRRILDMRVNRGSLEKHFLAMAGRELK